MSGFLKNDNPELIPILQEVFLNEGEIVGVTMMSNETGDHFMSTSSPLEVSLKKANGLESEKLRVFVKRPCLRGHDRLENLSLATFNNEIFMYKSVLPILGVDHLVGQMFAGRASTSRKRVSESYAVLEDLTVQGFTVPKQAIFMDLPHLTMTLRGLGQFHAQSYVKNITEELAEMSDRFKDIVMPDFDQFALIAQVAVRRATEHRQSEEVVQKFRNLVLTYEKSIQITRMAEDPIAVVCHGDFNLNNLFFKYDDQGQPIEVKFFDFQYSCYGDPTIDLAFILYLNTNQELRDDHWNLLLDTYWQELDRVPDLPFSKTQFFDNFSRKIISSVISACHFLPVLLSRKRVDFNKILTLPKEELAEFYTTIGGDEATKRIRQIVDDVLEKGYLAKSVNFSEEKLL